MLTGPAKRWADLQGMQELPASSGDEFGDGESDGGELGGRECDAGEKRAGRKVNFVNHRAAVILILVDGTVAPNRAEVDLINAVSAATGRCAVGLAIRDADTKASATKGAVFLQQWRAAVPRHIPVGMLDASMVTTLLLLAQGPARPGVQAPLQRRRQLLGKQLSGEQVYRHRGATQELARIKRHAPMVLQEQLQLLADDATQSLSERSVWRQPDEAELAAVMAQHGNELVEKFQAIGLQQFPPQQSAQQARQEARVRHAIPVPLPPELDRNKYWLEAVSSVLVCGAAIGCIRVLSELAGGFTERIAMLPAGAANGMLLLIGITLATAMAFGGISRKKHSARMRWLASWIARLRRSWEQRMHEMIEDQATAIDNKQYLGWRYQELENALAKEKQDNG